jgi:hypothetical protein
MPKAHLFFSHSTADASPERAALKRVADAVAADDYQVLLDRAALQAGGNWRQTIDGWIKDCDAAVILITPESIASDYCRYEWAALSFRRRMQKQFLVIPIYLGSAPGDINTRADQISEISGYFNFADIADIIPGLKARLATEIDVKQERRMQIELIADALRKTVKENVIDTAARNINIDIGGWDFTADTWVKFAGKVMGVGLVESYGALQDLRRFLKDRPDEFGVIVELIGRCSWVNMDAAQHIRACALRQKPSHGLFGLNAEGEETARCYVLTGSDKHPGDLWPFGIAFNAFGDDEKQVHARVRAALIEALKIETADPEDDDIREEVDLRRELKEPIFVVLQAQGLDAAWIKGLCESKLFAGVNFLILTGATGTPGLLPDEAVLKPALQAGFEHKLWSTYDKIAVRLGVPRPAVRAQARRAP